MVDTILLTSYFFIELVSSWLELAVDDSRSLHNLLGGTQLLESDYSTHWISPTQFFTWWKNNVERKAKFDILLQLGQSSSDRPGDDQRLAFLKDKLHMIDQIM